jgi:hypothetical protein
VEEMKKFAGPAGGKYWVLREEPQQVFEFATQIGPTKLSLPARRPEDEYSHNEILYTLAMLGQAAGFTFHVGKREQSAEWSGQQLSEISVRTLPFLRGADTFTKDKVVQIDLVWLDAARAAFAFEVEHTTSITSALDRFIELLKLDGTLAERLVIIAPKSRQKKMNQVLGSSHYIGAPMYMDTKVRYLWYTDVLDIARQFSQQQPTKASLAEAILRALHIPKAKPAA